MGILLGVVFGALVTALLFPKSYILWLASVVSGVIVLLALQTLFGV
jgi:hypothetical protein